MTPRQKIELRMSERRSRINHLLGLADDERTDETATEIADLSGKLQTDEVELRAAIVAEEPTETREQPTDQVDAEHRERLELRSKASVGRFLASYLRGRLPDGAEAELQAAAGLEGIPMELWEPTETRRAPEDARTEDRAISPAPATTGVNLDTLRPAVFAPSLGAFLNVQMPQVASGVFASGTLTQNASADAVAKGADVPETPAAFTVQTTTPHRVGASMAMSVEDIATVGQANFESILREHISLVLSDELDDQLLNGDQQNDDLAGFFKRLADPAAAIGGAAAASFTNLLDAYGGAVDGLWASKIMDVAMVVGVASYRIAISAYRTADSDRSFVAYAEAHTSGFRTNKRMPDAVGNVQSAIVVKRGRSMMPGGAAMTTALCPHYGSIAIDDVFSGARKGERRFVISVLVGDLILTQPDAYQQLGIRIAA